MANEELLPEVVQLLSKGNSVTLKAKGNSMLPLLKDGRDHIVLVPFDKLKKGDVVLAEINTDQYVLHRIIDIRGSRIILMGDGNLRGKEICNIIDIAGVAKSFIRKGKSLDCNSLRWKIYSKVWPTLRPIRRYLLAIFR